MHKRTALALSTLCLAIPLASCGEKRTVQALPTPPERLVCSFPPGHRPPIPPELQIDWSHVTSVAQAKIEHEGYVRSIRAREGVITSYIVDIEGKLFECATNMQWRRDFEKGVQ